MDAAVEDFVNGLDDAVRPLALRVIETVQLSGDFDVTVKWRQLTFAVGDDFDHWICAVSATRGHVTLKFHFGSLLDDRSGSFIADDSKFVRKIRIAPDPIDAAAIADLLDQALGKLWYFKQHLAPIGFVIPVSVGAPARQPSR